MFWVLRTEGRLAESDVLKDSVQLFFFFFFFQSSQRPLLKAGITEFTVMQVCLGRAAIGPRLVDAAITRPAVRSSRSAEAAPSLSKVWA